MTRNRRRCRPGNAAVVVAVSLTALLSVVALSLDGGVLMDKRRQVQSAADAAALAAADDLYYNWFTYAGADTPGKSAKAAARAAAAGNGFTDGQNGCVVTVNIPPLSGPFTGMAGHAEVIISFPQPRYFSRVFGTDDVTVGARAVGRGRRNSIDNGIIVLDPSGRGALNAGGGGGISVTGAPVLVNSNDAAAMIANGNGTVSAPRYNVAGSPGVSTPGGGTFSGTVTPNSSPVADPLRFLPVPDPSTMTVQSNNKTTLNGNNTTTLQPGVYVGGISITGKGKVNLQPGVYYMQGGGFNWSGQGDLSGSGVMIYNAPTSNSDKIDLTGQGKCDLSPPTSGTYQGITFFQERTSTVPVNVAGNGGMTISGAFYAASATLNVTGNGTTDVIGAQYISYDLVTGGNGSFSVSWTADTTPGTRDIALVE